VPEAERPDFALYVDEFQNYSTDSFADILSEARKYGLNLIVANQFTTQLTDEIRDAIFGNVGSIISFRVGTADAEFLAKQFAPVFDADDLQRIPNYNTVARMLIGGIPTQPFSMAGLPPLGSPNKELGDALKQLSNAKHGKPKAVVEKEIFDRISTPAVDVDAKNNPVQGQSGSPQKPARPSSGSSFLDDWLQKKETNSFRAPASPFKNSQTSNQNPVSVQQGANPVSQQTTQPSAQNIPQTTQQAPGAQLDNQNTHSQPVVLEAQQQPSKSGNIKVEDNVQHNIAEPQINNENKLNSSTEQEYDKNTEPLKNGQHITMNKDHDETVKLH
jgi:hypothetical protein